MKSSEIRSKSIEEIGVLLDEAREEYFKLRFQFSSGQLTDTSQLKVARKKVARIATILNESETVVPEGEE
jgi:large subunit ribosomal protein L29